MKVSANFVSFRTKIWGKRVQLNATTTVVFFVPVCTVHLEIEQELQSCGFEKFFEASAFCGVDFPEKTRYGRWISREKKECQSLVC